MAEFDAELYLRLTGERTLLDPDTGHGQPGEAPLGTAAHALVAVRAMTAAAAQAIVDDYALALAYRTGEHQHRHHRLRVARRPAPAPTLGPLRAVRCLRLIEQPWGQLFLSYLVLGDEVTVLHVTMTPALPPPGPAPGAGQSDTRSAVSVVSRAGGRGRGPAGHTIGPGLPAQLTVTDDRGTTAAGSFSGGGDGTVWRGEFEIRPPLAPETAWIELLGEWVELPAPPAGTAEVRVEPRQDRNLACGYLWARLASLAQFHSPDVVDTSIETLVAAGALAADDPAIAEVRAVVNGLFSRAGAAGGSRAALPEPWRSMLGRRGQAGGPQGLVVAGVTTPPFDGVTVALLAVRSADEEFTADVEIVPALPHWHASPGVVDGPMVAWWAADDRGHHYLGRQGSWHSGPDRSGGQIEFWPALDPAARVLDIMPTTMSARAVIRLPLDWGEDR